MMIRNSSVTLPILPYCPGISLGSITITFHVYCATVKCQFKRRWDFTPCVSQSPLNTYSSKLLLSAPPPPPPPLVPIPNEPSETKSGRPRRGVPQILRKTRDLVTRRGLHAPEVLIPFRSNGPLSLVTGEEVLVLKHWYTAGIVLMNGSRLLRPYVQCSPKRLLEPLLLDPKRVREPLLQLVVILTLNHSRQCLGAHPA